MTIGIYAIINKINGKCYVGKSINIERRFTHHRHHLNKKDRSVRQTNRHLFDSVKKYGIDSFSFEIVESFDAINECLISERELFWMDFFMSTSGNAGYNLRRDSSTGMIIHPSTRKILSENNKGVNNPNYGNKWSEDKKKRMSDLKSKQHVDGVYDDEWKSKIGVKSKAFWADNPDVKSKMASKVSQAKQKFDFIQMDDDLNVIRVWPSIQSIIECNPDWKWQNIYSVCNGYKKRIYGFKWKRVLKNVKD